MGSRQQHFQSVQLEWSRGGAASTPGTSENVPEPKQQETWCSQTHMRAKTHKKPEAESETDTQALQ